MLARSAKLIRRAAPLKLVRGFSINAMSLLSAQVPIEEQAYLRTVRLSGKDEQKKTEISELD